MVGVKAGVVNQKQVDVKSFLLTARDGRGMARYIALYRISRY